MKIILDVDRLLEEGRISRDEHQRLIAFALEETGSIGLNLLFALSVMAVAAGIASAYPSPITALGAGFALMMLGEFVRKSYAPKWRLLSGALQVAGMVAVAGVILGLCGETLLGLLFVALFSLAWAILTRSGPFIVIAAWLLAMSIGGELDSMIDERASLIPHPAITVMVFGLSAWLAYRLSFRLKGDARRLTIVFSRMALLLVNVGFWSGSLWGDSLGSPAGSWHDGREAPLPDWLFALAWAIGLIATGIWAFERRKRWVVNLIAVFGCIHFCSQLFGKLDAEPTFILIAGVVGLGVGSAINRYNEPGD